MCVQLYKFASCVCVCVCARARVRVRAQIYFHWILRFELQLQLAAKTQSDFGPCRGHVTMSGARDIVNFNTDIIHNKTALRLKWAEHTNTAAEGPRGDH